MMNKWYENRWVAIVWAALRIWLGVQWLEAGWHKLGAFDAGGFLQGALAKAGGEAPVVQGWYAAFLEHVALPNVKIINILIPAGEILVGLGLIVGALTIPALIAGAFMNLNFLLAGTISTNPILLAVAIILLFVINGTVYYGVDRFLVPATIKNLKDKNIFKKFRRVATQ
ncbi:MULTISPECIES: DoxX family membrane protein [unclassified Bacillus (in: firmicutes)]|uniref:DoxX family membrane protein n=1 Tax=unclassified Bacillus (in: firmicutes) TaxID=185979 RepID=UPI001A9567D3|nr:MULTISPECIES: DoxX family membrane protein [unclassified Bacillus (in: firmicutes)]MBO0993399.1 DoxX family membrane protein [Bacillus sp. SD088]MBO0993724.1 DoxX family membrane protein [Bacillus sp. SD088]